MHQRAFVLNTWLTNVKNKTKPKQYNEGYAGLKEQMTILVWFLISVIPK